jgi:hypothetical protein
VEDVLLNVRELCRLDASYVPVPSLFLWAHSILRRMFISRTVAAEVLMEAESNRAGHAVLKTLDREGGLRFPLAYVSSSPLCDFIERKCISSLVEDLIKVRPSGTIYPGITQTHFISVVYQVSLDHDDISRSIA